MRLATFMSQAPGDSIASCCSRDIAYQRAYVSLYHVLRIGQGAEESVPEIDQLTPLAHDRAQARIEPVVSWLSVNCHGVHDSFSRIAITTSTRQPGEV